MRYNLGDIGEARRAGASDDRGAEALGLGAFAALEFAVQGLAEEFGLGALFRLLAQQLLQPRLRAERVSPENFL
jgi:hypothetical protein